jgi:single-stranded DNA-binding protein
MNNVQLVGRLAKDPIARDRGDTRITELTLVTERPRIRDGKVEKDPQTGYRSRTPSSTRSPSSTPRAWVSATTR